MIAALRQPQNQTQIPAYQMCRTQNSDMKAHHHLNLSYSLHPNRRFNAHKNGVTTKSKMQIKHRTLRNGRNKKPQHERRNQNHCYRQHHAHGKNTETVRIPIIVRTVRDSCHRQIIRQVYQMTIWRNCVSYNTVL